MYLIDVLGLFKDLKVSDIIRGSCRFLWKMLDDDGGDRIKGYVIEKKIIDGKVWIKVNLNCGSIIFVIFDFIFE